MSSPSHRLVLDKNLRFALCLAAALILLGLFHVLVHF